MVYLILVLAAVVVVLIGVVFVGDAVAKTVAMPAQVVIDAEEAIEFCAEALPDEITATLSYDDLRRLLRLHLEWIQAYHWAPASSDAGPIVFEQYDPLAYVMERAAVVGLDIDESAAAAAIAAHSDYLVISGALHLDDASDVAVDLEALPLIDRATTPELDAGQTDGTS